MQTRLIFRALRHRNFRLFFIGQGISLIGTWMQSVAVGWLAYRLTGSALVLGLVGFSSQIPAFIFSPFAGVFVDRTDKYRLLILTQALSMLQAAALAWLTWSGHINTAWILFLSALLGVVNAFDIPGRQSFFIHMLEKREDLGNAIALNSSMFNAARLIGPSIAGVIIAFRGELACFALNAVSYLAVIAAFLAMRIVQKDVTRQKASMIQELKEGFSYVLGFRPIRYVLLLLSLASLMGMPYTVLMPVFARQVLHGDARIHGFLVGATGLGALAAGIYMAARRDARGLSKNILAGLGLFGVGLVFFSLSQKTWLALPLVAATGFGMMMQMMASNTVLQSVADDDKRGRVMSYYTMAFMGMSPLGSLLGGYLASHIGVQRALAIGGFFCVLGALFFWSKLDVFRREVREVYLRKGVILPETIPAAPQANIPLRPS